MPQQCGIFVYLICLFHTFDKSFSMCNYMGHRVSRMELIMLKDIEKRYGVDAALDVLHSGFTYSDYSVFVSDGPNDFKETKMHWEFIPPWIKNEEGLKAARKQGIPWLNARSETLLVSKMFGPSARKRRCLVPATHFFEWRHYKPDGAKKDIAYPYVVELADQSTFLMAGIWTPWTDRSTGETIDTFAVVTTAANDLMSIVHNNKKRQPTILTKDLAWDWMMKDLNDDEIQRIASFQLPSEQMSAYTIPKDFKSATDPLAPFDYDELPDLDLAV